MNPTRITATGFRVFDSLDLDLPAGCCAIIGPNGAGKSTLVNGIDLALFAGRGELAGQLMDGVDELELELSFEHRGDEYRVRRGYASRNAKTTLDLERWEP